MKIYQFEIPISDYYGKEVFFKCLYFVRESCPTRNEVMEALKKAAEVDRKMTQGEESPGGVDDGEFAEALRVLESTKEFPQCYGDLIRTNIRVKHPKFGDQPLSCQVIVPLDTYPRTDFQKAFQPKKKIEVLNPDLKDVHTEHCCTEHGCKYGDDGCSVTEGLGPSNYCETCYWDEHPRDR